MPERWTDERIDDLNSVVKANDHRLDTVQDVGQTNQRDIKDINVRLDKQEASKKTHKSDIALYLAIVAAYAAVIVQFFHH